MTQHSILGIRMGLIKSTSAPAAAAQPFSMRDIETHAKGILMRARQQADQLLQAAQVEAEFLRQKARQEGHHQGKQEGLAQGLEEGRQSGYQQALTEHQASLTETVNMLVQILTDLDASRHRLESEALTEVINLSTAIARRVTKRQGLIDPAALEANVHEAMKLVVQSKDVRIAIHPSQRVVLNEALPRLQLDWPQLEHVAVVEDASLSPGGCKIYCRQGEVDADLDGQLDRVIDELLPTPT